MKPLISLQLWSVQEACAADFLGTLTKVKEFGYDGVEFAGYYDVPAEQLKAHLDELGLAVSGSHLQLSQLEQQLEATLAYEKTLGNKHLIVPFLQGEDLPAWQAHFATLQAILPRVREAGMLLGYHNHAHEFTQFPAVNIMEAMAEAVPGLFFEVDTYWVEYAGVSAVEWMSQQQAAVTLLHIKDMLKTATVTESTEIGRGSLPIKSFVSYAQTHEIKWLVVEQEAFQRYTPMESAAINVTQLRKIVNEVY